MRSWLREFSGGLGDSGLLIPIAVALIAENGLDATAVFGGVGLAYVGTALYFRVPVPVQPLKAFAAAAIALQLDAETIAAGALLMAAAMAVLSISGLANWLAERFPLVLVRGIQASVALLLAKASVDLAQRGNWEGLPTIDPTVGVLMAAAACGVLLATRGGSRIPGALAVLAAGIVVGLAVGGLPTGLAFGPGHVSLSIPDGPAFGTALTSLVLAQIPLTFGNSIVATTDAERSYFGPRARRVQPRRLAGSIALSDTLAGLASGLPVCHGAGGVTAHYKLGARSHVATLSAGALFLFLALLLGSSLPALLTVIAPPALAGMLFYVAVQHGLLAGSLERLDERVIAACVGLVTILSGNLAIGFGFGVAVLLAREGLRRATTVLAARPVQR